MKLKELQEFIKEHPDLFKNRTWPRILECELPMPFKNGVRYFVFITPIEDD